MTNQTALNIDCMEYMKTVEDKYFDLAIVDPPYGLSNHETKNFRNADMCGGKWASKYSNKIKTWDKSPNDDYFKELFRVSKNQIIWGGNYFELPKSRCFIIWDKKFPETFSMAMCEYAWTSFNKNAKIYRCVPNDKDRFHPTQKPISLYKWILNNYGENGFKILDTHMGSGSSRCACYDLNFDYVGCEIDKEYFDMQEKRFKEYTQQIRLNIF